MAGRLQRSTDLLSKFMRQIVVVKLDNGNIIVSGVASALLFISGVLGLIVGTALTRRRRLPEVV